MTRAISLLAYLALLLLCILLMSENVKAHISQPSTYQIQQSKRFVVQIICDKGEGTGVIVDGNKIMTALHVVQDSYQCIVLDNKNNDYPVIKIKANLDADLAVLTINAKLKHKVRIAKEVYEYAPIWTVGNPLNYSYIVSEGRNNGLHPTLDFLNISSMSIIFGNSGGPVFVLEDKEIKLAGIVDAITSYQKQPIYHLSIFINLKYIKAILK